MTELATIHPVVRQGMTRDQIDLIKRTVAKGTSDDELTLFILQCERSGLDPLARQIYCVKRREYDRASGQYVERAMTQISIDGSRLVAARTGEYEGQVGPFWCGPDGVWTDVWMDDTTPPVAAKVGVWRTGFREPAWGIARFTAYAQTTKDGKLNSMWARMGDTMIAKCAESLALRKAFPQELSGLYTADEMGQASNEAAPAMGPYDHSKPAAKGTPMIAPAAAVVPAPVLAAPPVIDKETGEVLTPHDEVGFTSKDWDALQARMKNWTPQAQKAIPPVFDDFAFPDTLAEPNRQMYIDGIREAAARRGLSAKAQTDIKATFTGSRASQLAHVHIYILRALWIEMDPEARGEA